MIILSTALFILSIAILVSAQKQHKKELWQQYAEGFKDGSRTVSERFYMKLIELDKKKTDQKTDRVH